MAQRGPYAVLGRAALRRLLLLLLLVFLGADGVRAQGEPKHDTPGEAAKKVRAAFEAKSARALKALAARSDPDPWLVVDLLCVQGRHDAAEAFARATPRKDVEKLAAYVESHRGKPDNAAARKALELASRGFASKDPKSALDALEGIDTSAGDIASVRVLYGRGLALRSLRRLPESAQAFEAAATLAGILGWSRRAASGFQQSGLSLYYRSDWSGAMGAWKRRLAIEELRENRHGIAATLGNLGIIHSRRGAYATALKTFGRSLKLSEELGDRARTAQMLGNIGVVRFHLGTYTEAIRDQERAAKLHEALHNRAGVAQALGNLGLIHRNLGAYARALDDQSRSLRIVEQLGDRGGAARALGNIGNIYLSLGTYAKALAYDERALKRFEELGDRARVAGALGNIGLVHEDLGAYAKALEYQRRALTLQEQLGDRLGVATTLGNMGNLHDRLGAHAKALEYQERSLKIEEELGNRAGVAMTLGNIGIIQARLGAHEKALEVQERSLKLCEELHDLAGVARALLSIGLLQKHLGANAKALEYIERSRVLAAELGLLDAEVHVLANLARIQLALHDPVKAARVTRLAVEKLPALVGRLAEEQGAKAREQWSGLLETGVSAGMQLKDPGEVSYFVESGRAGALLESLGSRDALLGAAIPPNLREEEIAARAAVLEAQVRHGRALRTRKLKAIHGARADLKKSRGELLKVVAQIQRAAKAKADVVYPKAAPLSAIEASLAAREALVLYALLDEETVALVVTAKGARIVPLGESKLIEAAVKSLVLDDPETDPTPALAALRHLLVEPLKLSPTAKRVLISPHKDLAYLPFVLLFPAREVVYVPSGTTYLVLRDERAKRGAGVLALGDPDYTAKVDRNALLVLNRGGSLVPLPGTREEAKSVGDVVLLGTEATETGLRAALKKTKRWRAVHLACHGLVDPERPLLSSLALTPGGGDDGFLTTLEVFQMEVPADLVVLSACETAKGRVYESEGIVGFTRAFMFAGAPRVMVSLWKVDDEATRALMERFYALWKTLPTAAALKRAQQSLRDSEQWKHPYYWAAWQLWGLGD